MDFYCPISGCIFLDPIKLGEHTFEYRPIKEWVRENKTHPFTRKKVSTSDFVDDLEMESKVEKYLEENPEEKEFQYVDVLSNKRLLDKYFKSILYANQSINKQFYRDLLSRTDFIFTDIKSKLKSFMNMEEYVPKMNELLIHILNNFDYSSIDSNSNTLLHYVCKINYETIVKHIVNKVDLNLKGKYGNYPIHYVVMNNNYDLACLLMEKSEIHLNVANEDEETPFYLACENGNLNMMNLTFYEGVQYIDSKGKTPLHGFVMGCSNFCDSYYANDLDIYRFLLDKGVDFNKQCEVFTKWFDRREKSLFLTGYELMLINSFVFDETIDSVIEMGIERNKEKEEKEEGKGEKGENKINTNVSMEVILYLFKTKSERLKYLYSNGKINIVECFKEYWGESCEDAIRGRWYFYSQIKITPDDEKKLEKFFLTKPIISRFN